jgi:hypothetical protein
MTQHPKSDGCSAGPFTGYLNDTVGLRSCCEVHDGEWADEASTLTLLFANLKWFACVLKTAPWAAAWKCIRAVLLGVVGVLVLSTFGIIRHKLIAWRRKRKGIRSGKGS